MKGYKPYYKQCYKLIGKTKNNDYVLINISKDRDRIFKHVENLSVKEYFSCVIIENYDIIHRKDFTK